VSLVVAFALGVVASLSVFFFRLLSPRPSGNVVARPTMPFLPPRPLVLFVSWLLNGLEDLREALLPPEMKIVEMAHAHWKLQGLSAVTRLGVPDAIPLSLPQDSQGWPTVEAVAERTGVPNVDLLYRTMRLLATVGVFREFPGRRFSHTPSSALLRQDHPATLRSMVLCWSQSHYESWSGLHHQIATGELAFSHTHAGKDLWQYYNEEENKEELTHFQKMFDEISRTMTGPLVWDFDWKRLARNINRSDLIVADVGGGLGGVLAIVLEELPEARGILFDQPTVIEKAQNADRWTNGPHKTRISFETGTFLEKVPVADIYVLRMILHDWPDDVCVSILKNIRKAMRPNGRIVVVEGLLKPEGQHTRQVPVSVELQDIHMVVMLDGKERSAAQFREIFEAAGLRLQSITYSRGLFHLIEGTASE